MTLRLPARAALACLALAGSVPCAHAEVASWYGSDHRTANGERFAPDGLTAAHKTLRFGTRVRVTCLATGRSVVVRITDRGPFVAGRAIDLSRGAARAIGLTGIGRVHLAIL
ncbi:MAG: septal ring lytic transglycosylase RlpA family protein [Parafilimonas terrae]|nr:septal ring lytic transglycosylase RlpA family protein [Parafilimonas terrae]